MERETDRRTQLEFVCAGKRDRRKYIIGICAGKRDRRKNMIAERRVDG